MDPQDEVLASRVGQRVGEWTLRRLIGSGGMAAVYAAEHAANGRFAALKLLHPEMSLRGEIRERFLREAAVMARIQHPGTVTVYEQGESDNFVYLAMELLTGETVADRVRRLGRLLEEEVLTILDQVLDVLATAHAMGVIHRDLKPDNLFLTADKRVKVLDFGLARLLDSGPQSFRTRPGAALGTLPYMAPEQALGRRDEIDARTDLFALGATAYRLLTGRRIHEAKSEAALLTLMASEPAQPLNSVAPAVRADVGSVVDRSLCFSKHGRYPDARAMQRDVRALLAGEPPYLALQYLEGEARATLADRPMPKRGPGSSPLSSTRSLQVNAAPPASAIPTQLEHGNGEAPAEQRFDELGVRAEVALGVKQAAHVAHGQRELPATVVMPHSTRNSATLTEFEIADRQAAPIPVNIPIAPMSEAILGKRHRQRFVVGCVLLLGMLGAITAAFGYWFSVHEADPDPAAPSASTIESPVRSPGLTSTPSVSRRVRDASGTGTAFQRFRHPPKDMHPLDEAPEQDPSEERH